MPIDRCRYSPDWPEISQGVKVAAGWCCADCDRPCRQPGESWAEHGARAIALGWGLELHKPQRFVLTVAHLDQNPRNDLLDNLRALCVLCHLAYDRPFLQHNRRRKQERLGQLNLLEPPSMALESTANPNYLQPPLWG
jgi:hypothetical protein